MDRKICILGLGYIGLPTASMLAAHGYRVVGVDSDEKVLNKMSNEEVHIKEPGLDTLVLAALKSMKLDVKREPEPSDVFIICVPTPINEETKEPDLSFVKAAAQSILPHLSSGNLVILESTVPPLTTQNIVIPILEQNGLKAGKDLFVAYCPERVLPGKILTELVKNNRIIGGFDPQSAHMARDIYSSFVEGDIHTTDIATAEMVKLMENTFRDVNIALANEFLKVAEKIGVDVWDAIALANRHPRVDIHSPGPGVGGHCIAVDPWFLVDVGRDETGLMRTARKTNDDMPSFVVDAVDTVLKGLEKPVVTIFGVAYKGNIGDTRLSPALEVISLLNERGYNVRVFDPLVEEFQHELLPLDKAVEGSDCVVVLADHRGFNYLDPEAIVSQMRHSNLIDTKNCLSTQWKEAGFTVRILGHGSK
jgi:UDP-N-acetyl-D-mannosaminuronic acid dehydrogenase